jgi:hypothetical protein
MKEYSDYDILRFIDKVLKLNPKMSIESSFESYIWTGMCSRTTIINLSFMFNDNPYLVEIHKDNLFTLTEKESTSLTFCIFIDKKPIGNISKEMFDSEFDKLLAKIESEIEQKKQELKNRANAIFDSILRGNNE